VRLAHLELIRQCWTLNVKLVPRVMYVTVLQTEDNQQSLLSIMEKYVPKVIIVLLGLLLQHPVQLEHTTHKQVPFLWSSAFSARLTPSTI
jgi:hypothetical protein